ncbi:MAG: AAA family ATPase [Myxococcota bacterium]
MLVKKLVEDLLQPAAYGLPAGTRIRLEETHTSWVFLTGSWAYKVKKPVNLGFLDFSTESRRQQACNAELVLNRRLAPGVYQAVEPVRRTADGRYVLQGEGPIVDWAVKMVQLPRFHRADTLLARGALTPAQLDHLAEHLARFHEQVRHDPETAAFGRPEVIRANMEENFRQTTDAGAFVSEDELREIQRWQRDFLSEHAERFEARMTTGHVRDGHGDLRLEHVYFLEDGTLTIIDCIEFNDRFRYADVASDVAFLSMDLARAGYPGLAEYFLARYAAHANDFDLYSVVDFYQSYRAYVRAKTSMMLHTNTHLPDDLRDEAVRQARACFQLALPAARVPAVIAVGGWMAAGKSTLAERLSLAMSAPVVDTDRTRKHLMGVPATQTLSGGAFHGAYTPETTERVYTEMLRRAEMVLESGRAVILDASFQRRGLRSLAAGLAHHHNVPFMFLECRAPREACIKRLRDRAAHPSVSDARPEIFDAFLAHFEPVEELSEREHLRLDTSLPPDEVAEVAREWATANMRTPADVAEMEAFPMYP